MLFKVGFKRYKKKQSLASYIAQGGQPAIFSLIDKDEEASHMTGLHKFVQRM